MCHLQTLTGLPKHLPNKITEAPRTVCYTENMTDFPKVTNFETTNLKPGELIHIAFAFYNVTSTIGFTSILTVVCENTRMIWVFTTESKISPVRIICFVLTTLRNKKHL